jgi:hypothetical protein
MNDMFKILKLFSILVFALSVPLAWAETGDAFPGSTLSKSNGVFDAAISDDMLAGQRGMALITNTNDLDAALHSNSATDVVTGYNMVSEGSLTNNAGLSTVIQNSGNNVLIQNAVILNIQMQ